MLVTTVFVNSFHCLICTCRGLESAQSLALQDISSAKCCQPYLKILWHIIHTEYCRCMVLRWGEDGFQETPNKHHLNILPKMQFERVQFENTVQQTVLSSHLLIHTNRCSNHQVVYASNMRVRDCLAWCTAISGLRSVTIIPSDPLICVRE